MIKTLFEKGYFSDLDYQFARAMMRITGEKDDNVFLSAALVSRFTAMGNTCLDIEEFAGKPIETEEGENIEESSWPEKEKWLKSIRNSSLVNNGPLVLDNGSKIYLSRYFRYENRLADDIRKRINLAPQPIDEQLLSKGIEELFSEQNEQCDAAYTAVRNRFTVISGGPGTGKTTAVVRIMALIIDQAKDCGLRIILAAPTGKAASRLEESVRKAAENNINPKTLAKIPVKAHTLHSLLKPNWKKPTQFIYNSDSHLPVDLLVVDEASMIDLALMTKLMEAVPLSSRILLLGDKDQLSSVEAGAVFGDICRAQGKIEKHIIHLKHSYRFDPQSAIGRLSSTVLSGNGSGAVEILQDDGQDEVLLVEPQSRSGPKREIERVFARQFGGFIKEDDTEKRLAFFDTFRILCAHRKGLFGAVKVNRFVEEILGLTDGRGWFPGTPLMILRNDKLLNLHNGDIGIVKKTGAVQFKGGDGLIRMISPSNLPQHEPVFAMTVHKSQGSEFENIVVILPENRSPIITRELLYTALTRARKKLTVIGSPDLIIEAVSSPVIRASGLKERIQDHNE